MKVALGLVMLILSVAIVIRLAPDALAMAVGVAFGLLAMTPTILLVYASSDPNSRARAREHWGLSEDEHGNSLYADSPAGYLEDDDDYEEVIIVQRPRLKQLTERSEYRGR